MGVQQPEKKEMLY